MEKTVILSFVLGLFFFAAPSLLNAQDTLAPPLVSETNTSIEQDSGSAVVKQTGGLYMCRNTLYAKDDQLLGLWSSKWYKYL